MELNIGIIQNGLKCCGDDQSCDSDVSNKVII